MPTLSVGRAGWNSKASGGRFSTAAKRPSRISHGPVVRKRTFSTEYPEIVVAYLKAVIEANDWITRNAEEATTKQEQWTSIPKEVLYLYFGGGAF